MGLLVNGQRKDLKLSPDAPIFQRVGDERLGLQQGSWIGGELMDFRAVGGTIEMLVYRLNFANPAADRYSRLALWQVHKTRQDLDAAFRPLNIGSLEDVHVVERGPSERPVTTEIIGSNARRTVRALRLRTLLGLRDSLFSRDRTKVFKHFGDAGAVGTSGQTVRVDAAQGWTRTGLHVRAGDTVTFDAEGTVRLSRDPDDTAGPAGSRTGRRAADGPMRDAAAGSLIAKIGDSGPILVGNQRTLARAPVSGELYLAVNDDHLLDNSGEYRVTITIGQ